MNIESSHDTQSAMSHTTNEPRHSQHFSEADSGRNTASGSNLQTLHVAFANWKGKKIRITTDESNVTDGDIKDHDDRQSGTTTHIIELKMRKPHMIFHIGDQETPNTIIGTGQLKNWSGKINVTLAAWKHHDQHQLQLKNGGKWWSSKSEITYDSPAFGGAPITWRSKSCWSTWDMICLDERGMPIAQFVKYGKWSMSLKKIGKIEFVADQLMSSSFSNGVDGGEGTGKSILQDDDVQRRRDEIIVVGLTLAYDQYIQVTNVAATAGAA